MRQSERTAGGRAARGAEPAAGGLGPPLAARTIALTVLAMVAFAANSVLCRLALGAKRIDPASFTAVRLVSGAAMLGLIVSLRGGGVGERGLELGVPSRWLPPTFLFLYAACFSFAYVTLSTGTGALLLFGAVQVTMIVAGLLSGERPGGLEWTGLLLALAGLVYLVSPGLTAPPLGGSLLMTVAGVAWGFYSLAGRDADDPAGSTTRNFVLAVPFALLVVLALRTRLGLSGTGVVLAVLSGALASGLGYVVWYAALRGLTATRAATVQLSVPVLAALGGVALLAEAITVRLGLAAVVVLGGVGLSILGRR